MLKMWDCPPVNTFWRFVLNEIEFRFGIKVPFTPKACLLCWFEGSKCISKKPNAVTAICMLLAKV